MEKAGENNQKIRLPRTSRGHPYGDAWETHLLLISHCSQWFHLFYKWKIKRWCHAHEANCLKNLSQSLAQTSQVLINRNHENILSYLNLGVSNENNPKSDICICYYETVSSNNENLASSYNFLFALPGTPK